MLCESITLEPESPDVAETAPRKAMANAGRQAELELLARAVDKNSIRGGSPNCKVIPGRERDGSSACCGTDELRGCSLARWEKHTY